MTSKYKPKTVVPIILSTDGGKRAAQRSKEIVTEETLERGRKRRAAEDILEARRLGISVGELQA